MFSCRLLEMEAWWNEQEPDSETEIVILYFLQPSFKKVHQTNALYIE